MNNLKQLITAFLLLALPMISKAQNIYTVAGDANQGFSGDGGLATAGNCEFNTPEGVYVDKAGNIYIGDEVNDVVRMVNTNGIINVFAGNHTLGLGYSGDNGPATDAQLNNPVGVCGDASGNIYIADYANNVIRMVNSSGIITTFAGTGIHGYNGDGIQATAAQLHGPVFIHCDIRSNLYIADYVNIRIRKVNTSGIISTIAGNGKYGYTGDGGLADTTELWGASGACADSAGNIYIADASNERIRKVNTSGIISTIAGNGYNRGGGGGYSGDGGQATDAELAQPQDVHVDASGNILFTDIGNARLRKIDASGIISTIGGNGRGGYTGNGGPATAAELNGPSGICIDSYTNVYFTDQVNEVVRVIAYGPFGINSIENNTGINIYPNPATKILFINTERLQPGLTTLAIMDITGREMFNYQLPIKNGEISIDISSLTTGMYFVRVNTNESQWTQKFIKQ